MSSLTKILVRTIISLAQGGFVYQSVTSAEFHFEHTLDFIAHGFCAGIAEMDMNLVGCLADFLYHRWRVFRRSGRSNGVCHLHSTGFSVHGAPFSERVCAAR